MSAPPTSVANTPLQALEVGQAGLLAKAQNPFSATAISAMFAGALIGFGFVFYASVLMGGGDWPAGLMATIGGVAFSGGLFVVIMIGADLFTSTTMTPMLAREGKLGVGRLLQHWAVVYLFNMIGAGLLVALVWAAGTGRTGDGAWGAVIVEASVNKVTMGWGPAFVRGILCNILVCLAVWVGFTGKTVTDRALGVIFPIALFVAAGFEHSVANMFAVPMGLVLAGDQVVVDAVTGADLSALTWGGYFLNNLLPVTLGNIVGGLTVAFGMVFWHEHTRRPRREQAATQGRAGRRS